MRWAELWKLREERLTTLAECTAPRRLWTICSQGWEHPGCKLSGLYTELRRVGWTAWGAGERAILHAKGSGGPRVLALNWGECAVLGGHLDMSVAKASWERVLLASSRRGQGCYWSPGMRTATPQQVTLPRIRTMKSTVPEGCAAGPGAPQQRRS